MIFDTHAHYDDSSFDEDRDNLIRNLAAKGVERVVNVGADYQGCIDTISLCERYNNVYGALGIHPSEVSSLNDERIDFLKEQCQKGSVLNGGKIVAVGEIGLDYHDDTVTRDVQKEWFKKQLMMAKEVNLPVIIHSRDAASDTYEIMTEMSDYIIGGIVHCYSYSVEMAEKFLKMGMYFGIGGVITFKNAVKLKDVVAYLPMDKIVLETDSPYLCPTPFRGERNDSSYIKYVAEAIAQIKGLNASEVIDITTANANRVYRICQH